ncbi:MAG: choice-of-anchor L domain-containing protein [Planctomycetes bacterium]|nr:choice-of-anchor L domain-containing protein [Planctomycetota bacterium]
MVEEYDHVGLTRGSESFFSPISDTQQIQSQLFANIPAGVTVDSISYVGHPSSTAIYSGLNWSSGSSQIQLPDGVFLCSGVVPPLENTLGAWSWSTGQPGDIQLQGLLGYPTFDASGIIVSFTTDAFVDTMELRLVFGSDEYPEFLGLQYNDGIGVFLDGSNIAFDGQGRPITVSGGSLTLNNSGLSVPGGTPVQFPIEYDGLTLPVVVTAPLTPGSHQLRIVIADGLDRYVDSGVFIGSLSFSFDCPGTAPPPVLTELPEVVNVLSASSLS